MNVRRALRWLATSLLSSPLVLLPAGCGGDGDDPEASGGSAGACACDASSVCCPGCKPGNERADCDGKDTSSWFGCEQGACVRGGALSTLKGPRDGLWIEKIAWSPDGTLLAAAAEDKIQGTTGETVVIRAEDGVVLHRVEGPASGVAWSDDGSRLAVGGAPISLWETSSWTKLADLQGTAGPVAFAPDGRIAAATSGSALLYAAQGGKNIGFFEHASNTKEKLWSVLFSPDGKLLVTATGQVGFGSPHGSVKVWDASSLKLLQELPCTSLDVAFSPGGKLLAGACWST
jgi:WD40 repeat protein